MYCREIVGQGIVKIYAVNVCFHSNDVHVGQCSIEIVENVCCDVQNSRTKAI